MDPTLLEKINLQERRESVANFQATADRANLNLIVEMVEKQVSSSVTASQITPFKTLAVVR